MKRQNLFKEVKSWLEAEKIDFQSDPQDGTFEGLMTTRNGMVQVRLHCEESPPILQVICPSPIKVPKEKTAETAVCLHNLNACLRIGAFCLNPEARLIVFRLTMPVRPEADLGRQFGEALGEAVSIWDNHLPPLALMLCSTPAAQETLAKFAPKPHKDTALSAMSMPRRLELN